VKAFLTIALALGIQSDEDDLWKMDQLFHEAKTVSLKIRREWTISREGETRGFKEEGRVAVKKGNKLSVSLNIAGEKDSPSRLICNGTQLQLDRGITPLAAKAPANLTDGLLSVLIRGVVGTWVADTQSKLQKGEFQSVDWKSRFKVLDLRAGGKDGAAKTLTYKVQTGADTIQFKLWYDPDTLRPLKRTFESSSTKGGPSSTGTESYEELTLNADIPDEAFKLKDQ
jgi:outer membrane lipoprotein-sorting protein